MRFSSATNISNRKTTTIPGALAATRRRRIFSTTGSIPYGNRVEHFFGGDLLNEDDETRVHPEIGKILESQWGARVADRRASLTTDYDPLKR